MRLTSLLRAQHLDRMFKKHWILQGHRNIIDMGAEAELKVRGIPVLEPQDILAEKRERLSLNVIGYKPKIMANDNKYQNYHEKKCHLFGDHDVLLEGRKQAMVLTKTVQLEEYLLPNIIREFFESTELPDHVHNVVKRAIFSSNVFDAEQQMLPKGKDPLRPAYNFSRQFGITDQRKSFLLSSKLLRLCEIFSNKLSTNILSDVFFSLPLTKNDDLIQFELHVENFIVSKNELSPVVQDVSKTKSLKLGDMFPVKSTVTLQQEHIYELKNIYPPANSSRVKAPHTILIEFTPTRVNNLYETVVTTEQILGRSLIKSFTVAASYAKNKYGDEVRILPQPVSVQCIQTDGKFFDFSLFQLNTLDLDNDHGIKNIWYQTEQLPLYEKCCYNQGVPTLIGYNPDIIKYMIAFCKNH